MKILSALIIMTLSLVAFAETNSEKKEVQKEEGASSRLIQKKREKMRGTTTSKPQRQETRVNDDFDPEADAIDDDMTKDEGMEND